MPKVGSIFANGANGDSTWENWSDPKCYIGHYTKHTTFTSDPSGGTFQDMVAWIQISYVRVQVVYPMSNMWIEPWAISPQYMDPTFE